MSETTDAPRQPWYAPSRVAAFAVLVSIPVKLLRDKIVDPDLWWHLQTGELIARGSLPRTDPYSFTHAGRPWIVQEWGSEVILHWLRDAFGMYGILFYRAAITFVLYLLAARLIARRMGSGIGTWALMGLVAYSGSANWTERPNLMSFVLFVVTLDLVDRRTKAIWWFVPMAALWANLHGMVVLGIGLLALVAITEALKIATGWEGADPVWTRRLALVTLAGAAATLLNPFGPRLLVHAFSLVRTVRDIVTEWGSPNFHEASNMTFLVLVLLTFAALAFRGRRSDPTDVALALAFTFLAMQARRNLALSAIVLGYVAASALPEAVRVLRSDREPRPPTRPSLPLGALGVVMALAGFAVLLADGFPRSNSVEAAIDPDFPIEAIDALDRPGVRLFVLDGWSGLVIDRIWPNARVFVDLRGDFYGADHVNAYRRTIAALPPWRTTLDGACVTHVLIRRTDPLAQVLDLVPDWQVEREDERSVTFRRLRAPASCPALPSAA